MSSDVQPQVNWWPIRLALAALLVLALCVIGVPWYVDADWVPEATRSQLPGATPNEVRALLGEPDNIATGPDHERWEYRRPFRWAEFRVDFGKDGRAKDEGTYDR